VLAATLALILSCGGNRRESYTSVLEGKSVQAPALTGGKVAEFFVREGDTVSIGARLVQLDTTELTLQLKQLLGALDELKVQEEIAGINVRSSETDLAYVREKHNRVEALQKNDAATRQSLDDLNNQLEKVQSLRDAAGQQPRVLAAKRVQLEAQIALVRKKLSDASVTAPSRGTVVTRYFEPGEAVPPLQPVVELMDLSELDVKVYVPEKKLAQVKLGQEVSVRVDGTKQNFTGRITWISPKAEFTPKQILTPETRTSLVYAVKVTVLNPDQVLKHGMPVEVSF
jgi:HlyD family secretion protein